MVDPARIYAFEVDGDMGAELGAGRFAPSPSGPLHIGNLRTALIAWCAARSSGRRFLLRMEDLTTGAASVAEGQQIADLESLGIDFDGSMVRQSEREARYAEVLAELRARELVYECFCTRKEIAEAATAPHGPIGAYPGTCLHLSDARRAEVVDSGRRPALRIRAAEAIVSFEDRLHGSITARADDFVLQRGDGMVAYNLAVIIDDHDFGIDQVLRGDDLLESTARQVLLQQILGFDTPEYIHVPLVLGPDRKRLSKRHGAVTVTDLVSSGHALAEIRSMIIRSMGIDRDTAAFDQQDILDAFRLDAIPDQPWIFDPLRFP